jgi:hypothetical protein
MDCASGARKVLLKDSQKVDEVTTDNFGDFKFDHLEPNRSNYALEIDLPDYEKKFWPLS